MGFSLQAKVPISAMEGQRSRDRDQSGDSSEPSLLSLKVHMPNNRRLRSQQQTIIHNTHHYSTFPDGIPVFLFTHDAFNTPADQASLFNPCSEFPSNSGWIGTTAVGVWGPFTPRSRLSNAGTRHAED